MQIETKFNVNQKVFCVDKERRIIKKPCKICNSSGTVKLKGKNYKCPACSSNVEYRNTHVIHEAVISKIKVSISDGQVHISYRCIYDRDKDLPLKEKHKETAIPEYGNKIFATLEEAEARCMELDKEINI